MISVVTPGARTLVQDAGRTGYAHLGIPTAGAADLPSLRLANRLVGNPEDTSGLEVALHGPTLTFHTDAVVAYVGADTDLSLDGNLAPTQHTLPVRAGQTLTVGSLRGGVYGYLAVAGGIDTDPVLGSRSTCTLSGLGHAAIRTGDTLPLGQVRAARTRYRAVRNFRPTAATVRYLPGPHTGLFDPAAVTMFESALWSISPDTSRVGIRLAGEPLPAPQESLPSLGMVTGAIQVPPTGTPIVLGPDHGTTGGYPVLGTVLGCDLPSLVQRLPGQTLRFSPVSLAQATTAMSESTSSVSLLHLDRVSA